MEAPLIGIARHRLTTDGDGVTTLVAFHGCPLRCLYCINDRCHDASKVWRTVTPEQLINEVGIDNLYFLATGGGVTFGGGEPLLYSEFIESFATQCPPQWTINIESSLYVPRYHLQRVLPYVRAFLIDIKDTNPNIYKAYTGQDNLLALDNLRWLMQHDGMAERVTVRLPHIPHHNTADDIAASRELLTEMGVTKFDEFDYFEKSPHTPKNIP